MVSVLLSNIPGTSPGDFISEPSSLRGKWREGWGLGTAAQRSDLPCIGLSGSQPNSRGAEMSVLFQAGTQLVMLKLLTLRRSSILK